MSDEYKCPNCGTVSETQHEPHDPDLEALECTQPETICRVWVFEPERLE